MRSLSARLLRSHARLRRHAYHRDLRAIVPFELEFRGLQVREVDITRLPFPDGSYDAAISNAVFEHVMDVPAALDDLRRVLKPGGFLRPAVPSHLNRLRESDYRRAFEPRFEILRWERKLEGEHLLTPAVPRPGAGSEGSRGPPRARVAPPEAFSG